MALGTTATDDQPTSPRRDEQVLGQGTYLPTYLRTICICSPCQNIAVPGIAPLPSGRRGVLLPTEMEGLQSITSPEGQVRSAGIETSIWSQVPKGSQAVVVAEL